MALGGVLVTVGLTVAFLKLAPQIATRTTVAFSYLLVVLAVSMAAGFVEAVIVSGCATFQYALFLPHVGSSIISDSQYWVALAIFLVTAIIASWLATSGRARAVKAEHLQLQEKLAAAEQIRLYADIVQNAQVGVSVWRLENPEDAGSFRHVLNNPAVSEVIRAPADWVRGRSMRESFPALLNTPVPEALREVVLSGKVKDLGVAHYGDPNVPEGYFACKAFPLPNKCVGLAFENVTERHRAEENLRESQEALRRLSARLVQSQDEERRRIGRELHDSTGQYLTAIQMNLALLKRGVARLAPDEARALKDAIEVTSRCTREIRTLAYLLHPPLLDEVGLASAIAWYVEGFCKRSGIRVEVQIPPEVGRLPREIETVVFRIVQESLTNIHRHSGSETAQIAISVGGREVTLRVSDQGRGIPTGALEVHEGDGRHLGVGIAGMRERLKQLGGRLEIQSQERGTLVTATLPLGPAERPLEKQPVASTALQ